MTHLVTAVLRPDKLDEVLQELHLAGVHEVTVTSTMGYGPGPQRRTIYRGAELSVDWAPTTRLEVVVGSHDRDRIAGLIVLAARTGSGGDGIVWTTPVDEVIRVRTCEVGAGAL